MAASHCSTEAPSNIYQFDEVGSGPRASSEDCVYSTTMLHLHVLYDSATLDILNADVIREARFLKGPASSRTK
eukprot:6473532-Amphidinium_carterae.1